MKVRILSKVFRHNYDQDLCTCTIKCQVIPISCQRFVNIFGRIKNDKMFKLLAPYTITATAKYNSEDSQVSYLEDYGENLSEARAKARAYGEGIHRFKEILKYVNILKSEIEQEIENLKSYQNNEYQFEADTLTEIEQDEEGCLYEDDDTYEPDNDEEEDW